jgi:hypothetical protein
VARSSVKLYPSRTPSSLMLEKDFFPARVCSYVKAGSKQFHSKRSHPNHVFKWNDRANLSSFRWSGINFRKIVQNRVKNKCAQNGGYRHFRSNFTQVCVSSRRGLLRSHKISAATPEFSGVVRTTYPNFNINLLNTF